MKTLISKLFLIVTLAALVLVALPVQNVHALGPNPAGTPDPAQANMLLEWAFAREQLAVERIGLNLEYSDALIRRVEDLLAKAKQNGKDVSAIETALTAYQDALTKGKPVYDNAKSIADGHAGFNGDGKVMDTATARQTVKDLRDALKQYRDMVGDAAQNLREAIRAFRQANPRSPSTPQP